MKKLLCVLMFGSLFAQYLPDMSDMNETEKMLVFENNEKHPELGVIFSIFLPTSGHAYAGNWLRGIIFTGSKYSAIIGGALLPEKCSTTTYPTDTFNSTSPSYGFTDIYKKCETDPISYVLFGLGVVLHWWEIIDAGKEVTRYNDKLYRHIFGKEPPSISFNLQPISNGANLTMSYAFK